MGGVHTFSRETRVGAPLEAVWDFHTNVDGLRALTPEFMNLEVHSVVGPDGEERPEVLREGRSIRMSIRPFGVGPRQRWVSVIHERRESEGAAMFRDEMVEGPFPEWEHTHQFFADGGGTRIVDRVEYRLPGGPLGRVASPLGVAGLEPMFRSRHRRVRRHFEGGETAAPQ